MTTGPESRIDASISARSVVVRGEISGDIVASEKVELMETSRVTGDVVAPRLTIAEGAYLTGAVDVFGARAGSPRQEPSTRRTQLPMSTLPRREFRPATS